MSMRVALLGLALLGVTACGALPEAAGAGGRDDGPRVGLHAGESMQFELSVAGIVVGQAQLAVGEAGDVDGRNAIAVTSRIITTGLGKLVSTLDDQATTVLDLATWLPLTTTSDATYGKRRTRGVAQFAGPKVEVKLRRNEDAPTTHRFDLEDNPAYDAHTAMAAVRTWDAAPGETRTIWLVGGKRLWRTDLTCIGAATVGTADGNRAAVRFDGVSSRRRPNMTEDPKAPQRTFSVWLSDDADRVPLRVVAHTELGDAELILTDYQR